MDYGKLAYQKILDLEGRLTIKESTQSQSMDFGSLKLFRMPKRCLGFDERCLIGSFFAVRENLALIAKLKVEVDTEQTSEAQAATFSLFHETKLAASEKADRINTGGDILITAQLAAVTNAENSIFLSCDNQKIKIKSCEILVIGSGTATAVSRTVSQPVLGKNLILFARQEGAVVLARRIRLSALSEGEPDLLPVIRCKSFCACNTEEDWFALFYTDLAGNTLMSGFENHTQPIYLGENLDILSAFCHEGTIVVFYRKGGRIFYREKYACESRFSGERSLDEGMTTANVGFVKNAEVASLLISNNGQNYVRTALPEKNSGECLRLKVELRVGV